MCTVTPLSLSLVIPVFNEAQSLPFLHEKIRTVFPISHPITIEIIYVDDGSTDGSLELMKNLQEQDPRIRIFTFPRNRGKTIALLQAFKHCRGAIIATLDADLQNDPSDIPAMIEQLAQGHDLVCGWRKSRCDSPLKTFPSLVINAVVRLLTKIPVHDINCGLKIFQRDIIETIQLSGKQHRYIPIKAFFAGYSVSEFIVQHHPRTYGRSKYGFLRFPEGIFDLITVLFMGKFERSPFYLFGGIGLSLFCLGAAILAYLSVGWLLGNWIASRPLFSISILLLIFGFQLLSLGLLAELMLDLCRPEQKIPGQEIKPHNDTPGS